MEFKQDTFGDIVESESQMLLSAGERYGRFFENAIGANTLLLDFIKSIEKYEYYFFPAFLSQVRTHHTLAVFSIVRQHHTQAWLNLRIVLEAGCWAAYGLVNRQEDKFFITDKRKVAHVPESLRKKLYKWTKGNFQSYSERIQHFKNSINQATAHSNIVYARQTFKMNPKTNPGFHLPFFDHYDEYKIKCDLFSVVEIALLLLSFFIEANRAQGVFTPIEEFEKAYNGIVKEHIALREELQKNDRYIATTANRIQ